MKVIVFFISVLLTTSIMADKKGHHHHGKQKEVKSVQTKISDQKLTGDIIGLTCYIRHGSKGHDHKSCAKDCAEKGLPLGLMVDNKIYQISGDGHSSLIEAYKPLLPYLEEKVEVEGTVFEKQGIKLLNIKKIKKTTN